MGNPFKQKKPPKAPDYRKLATEDFERAKIAAQEDTRANRPNQTDQYGNTIVWTEGPNGQWGSRVDLSPEQKSIQDKQTELSRGNLDRYSYVLSDLWKNKTQGAGGGGKPGQGGGYPAPPSLEFSGQYGGGGGGYAPGGRADGGLGSVMQGGGLAGGSGRVQAPQFTPGSNEELKQFLKWAQANPAEAAAAVKSKIGGPFGG